MIGNTSYFREPDLAAQGEPGRCDQEDRLIRIEILALHDGSGAMDGKVLVYIILQMPVESCKPGIGLEITENRKGTADRERQPFFRIQVDEVVEEVLKKGAKRAEILAQSTIQEVKKKMGLE